MKEEIWRDVPGYEGYYQVSNLGRVRSLDRVVRRSNVPPFLQKGRILKLYLEKTGYFTCNLCVNDSKRTRSVHQLMAMAFLNHAPNGLNLVVDHINNIKTDNRLDNLQIVTTRHNTSRGRKGTSKFQGVSWVSSRKRWLVQIGINRKNTFLGYFKDESEAALAYQNALDSIKK